MRRAALSRARGATDEGGLGDAPVRRGRARARARDLPLPLRPPIHDRSRAEALFDFRYRLEMYVPRAKREYGYYVLPILVGDRLVGRIEPRFDRKGKTLEVLGAWGDTSRADEALASLAAFLGAEPTPLP